MGGGKTKNFSSKIGVLMHFLWLFMVFCSYIVMKRHRRCRFKKILGKITFFRHFSAKWTLFGKNFCGYLGAKVAYAPLSSGSAYCFTDSIQNKEFRIIQNISLRLDFVRLIVSLFGLKLVLRQSPKIEID